EFLTDLGHLTLQRFPYGQRNLYELMFGHPPGISRKIRNENVGSKPMINSVPLVFKARMCMTT
ncbi:MAG: hypothetical protein WBG34_08410, partial [Flavobacteriales bacterium]